MQDSPIAKEDVSLWIDGQEVKAAAGSQQLKAVFAVAEIPHICYHSKLMDPVRSCDTCLVEVDGKLVRSCSEDVIGGSPRGCGRLSASCDRTAYGTHPRKHLEHARSGRTAEGCRCPRTRRINLSHRQGRVLEGDAADGDDRDKSHECYRKSLRQTERSLAMDCRAERSRSLSGQTNDDDHRNKLDFKGTK